jgi:hypothetical protein
MIPSKLYVTLFETSAMSPTCNQQRTANGANCTEHFDTCKAYCKSHSKSTHQQAYNSRCNMTLEFLEQKTDHQY